jgi:hypothetical protein
LIGFGLFQSQIKNLKSQIPSLSLKHGLALFEEGADSFVFVFA